MELFRALILPSVLLGCTYHGAAQNVEISAGPNYNKFFNYFGSEYNPTYGSGYGWDFRCGITNINLKRLTFSFDVGLTRYSGDFRTHAFGWTYSESHTAEVKNSTVSLSLYPFNIKLIREQFIIRIGLNLAYVFHSQISGYFKWNHPYSGGAGTRVLEPGLELPLVLSLSTQFSYYFKLNENWSITPSLNYQPSLTRDYNLEQPVRKMLTSFEIGFSRKL